MNKNKGKKVISACSCTSQSITEGNQASDSDRSRTRGRNWHKGCGGLQLLVQSSWFAQPDFKYTLGFKKTYHSMPMPQGPGPSHINYPKRPPQAYLWAGLVRTFSKLMIFLPNLLWPVAWGWYKTNLHTHIYLWSQKCLFSEITLMEPKCIVLYLGVGRISTSDSSSVVLDRLDL